MTPCQTSGLSVQMCDAEDKQDRLLAVKGRVGVGQPARDITLAVGMPSDPPAGFSVYSYVASYDHAWFCQSSIAPRQCQQVDVLRTSFHQSISFATFHCVDAIKCLCTYVQKACSSLDMPPRWFDF